MFEQPSRLRKVFDIVIGSRISFHTPSLRDFFTGRKLRRRLALALPLQWVNGLLTTRSEAYRAFVVFTSSAYVRLFY